MDDIYISNKEDIYISNSSLTLDDILKEYTISKLKELLKFANRKINYTLKKDLIQLVKNFINETTLKGLYERLNEDEKLLLNEVVHNKFSITPAIYEAKYKIEFPYNPFSKYSISYVRSYCTFFLFDGNIPIDFREELLSFVPKPPGIQLTFVPDDVIKNDKELVYKETVQDVFYDIQLTLNLIKNKKLSITENKKVPTKSTLKLLKEELGESPLGFENDFKAFALPLIILNGKLAVSQNGKLLLTKKGETVLRKGVDETVIKNLFTKWIKSNFDEFYRINIIKGKNTRPDHMTSSQFRKILIRGVLKKLPSNKWLTIEEFYMFMRANFLDFEVSRNPWQLYIDSDEYGSIGYCHEPWRLLQLRYLMVLFFEYLATLGVIDIAYTEPELSEEDLELDFWGLEGLEYLSLYDGLKYIRINDLGDYVLEKKNEFTFRPKEEHYFKILDNMEIIVLRNESPYLLNNLFMENFTNKISDNVFKFDKKTIMNAIKANIDIEEIFSFLESHSLNPISENIKIFFDDLKIMSNKLRYKGESHIIETDNDITAKEIVSFRGLKDKCFVFNKKYIVVPDEYYGKFKKIVEKNGLIVNMKGH